MNHETAIKVFNLSKKYNLYRNRKDRLKEALHPFRRRYHKDFWALRDVSLEVPRGTVLGVVGRNGSGKSTFLKAVAGVSAPTKGHVVTQGRVVALLELGSGFNPEFTGMENIYFYGSINGFTRNEINAMVDEIIAFADIGEHIFQPVKTYSSGMRTRLAFSVSTAIQPEILILDEVLAVGDELFKRKCYARMGSLMGDGVTVIFVSHSINAINELCREAVLLEKGELLLQGPAKLVTMYYQKLLYSSVDTRKYVLDEIRDVNAGRKHAAPLPAEGEDMAAEDGEAAPPSQAEAAIVDEDADLFEKTADRPYYVENFRPQSTVEYRSTDVSIVGAHIETLDGEPVNHLITGEEYVYEYLVRFSAEVDGAVFGFMIKSEKGVYLVAANSGRLSEERFNATPGSEYRVRFRFRNNLLKGNYFLNAGVSAPLDGKLTFLSRIEDACCFKVLPGEFKGSGVLSVDLRMNIERRGAEHSGTEEKEAS